MKTTIEWSRECLQEITYFRKHCEDNQYTDTGDAWELIDQCERAIRALNGYTESLIAIIEESNNES